MNHAAITVFNKILIRHFDNRKMVQVQFGFETSNPTRNQDFLVFFFFKVTTTQVEILFNNAQLSRTVLT